MFAFVDIHFNNTSNQKEFFRNLAFEVIDNELFINLVKPNAKEQEKQVAPQKQKSPMIFSLYENWEMNVEILL